MQESLDLRDTRVLLTLVTVAHPLFPSGGPQYMSSLSYLADSSLSEEMSQFDFSTGVQSYSYGSQDPQSSAGHYRRRVMKEWCWCWEGKGIPG